jgi:hypothetical protein
MSTDNPPPKKIIIEGVTEEGKPFRPSDWAERMSGSLSTFRNHRIYYSPFNLCVVLDPTFKESNPELYHHIMNFARANKLKICGEENDELKKD